jgi:hypothetical protein
VADHNDPKSVTSIFSDVDVSAADVYDMFGFPSGAANEEKVVLALTFAAVPEAGVWDSTPITPRTPPNPPANDTPFLTTFPYLAEPW